MYLFSYIISAALEAAITYIQYQATGEVPWIYAFLTASSLFSIGVEFSVPGEAARQALKEAGRNVECYDTISNVARTVIYFGVLFGAVTADKGAFMACGCIGAAMVMALLKL